MDKMDGMYMFVGQSVSGRAQAGTGQRRGWKCPRRYGVVRCQGASDAAQLQRLARSAAGVAFAVALNFCPGRTFAEPVLNPLQNVFQQPNTRINDDPESVLRWALPFNNKVVRELQEKLEDVRFDLRDTKWDSVNSHVQRASELVKGQAEDILAEIAPEDAEEIKILLGEIDTRLQRLCEIVAERSAEQVITLEKDILRQLDKIEEALVKNFPFEIPEKYKDLPQLRGRATVEMKLKKNDESGGFRIGGRSYETATVTMVVDGYSAPITAGNFVDLVKKGFYRKMEIKCADDTLVKTGDPEGEVDGYIDPRTEKVRRIPLEIKPRGAPAPVYGQKLEGLFGNPDSQLSLPFSAYGTLAMVRNEDDPNSASSQFFWFLDNLKENAERTLTPDGQYAAFGYVVDGEWFLREVQAGDVIVEAKVTSGLDKLIAAKEITNYKGAELERG